MLASNPPFFRHVRDGAAGYCRLVYCPGYGIDLACTSPPSPSSDTRDFWRLFERIATGRLEVSSTIRGHQQSKLTQRMAVAESLRDHGVWLVDASVTGLARPGRRDAWVAGSRKTRLLRESWERYVRPGLDGQTPEHIAVIGYGVRDAIRDRIGFDAPVHHIIAPAARRPDDHNRELAAFLRSLPWSRGV